MINCIWRKQKSFILGGLLMHVTNYYVYYYVTIMHYQKL